MGTIFLVIIVMIEVNLILEMHSMCKLYVIMSNATLLGITEGVGSEQAAAFLTLPFKRQFLLPTLVVSFGGSQND